MSATTLRIVAAAATILSAASLPAFAGGFNGNDSVFTTPNRTTHNVKAQADRREDTRITVSGFNGQQAPTVVVTPVKPAPVTNATASVNE